MNRLQGRTSAEARTTPTKAMEELEAEAETLRDEIAALDAVTRDSDSTVADLEHALTRIAALQVRQQAVQGKLSIEREKMIAAAQAKLQTEVQQAEEAVQQYKRGALVEALLGASLGLMRLHEMQSNVSALTHQLRPGALPYGENHHRLLGQIDDLIAKCDPERYLYTTDGLQERMKGSRR